MMETPIGEGLPSSGCAPSCSGEQKPGSATRETLGAKLLLSSSFSKLLSIPRECKAALKA